MTRSKWIGFACALLLAGAGCGSSSGNGDGGVVGEGGLLSEGGATNNFTLTSGNYKATATTAGTDGCMIMPDQVVTMMVALPVSVDATGLMKVGNDKGTPPMPSLGQGMIVRTSPTFTLTRVNHVKLDPPSTCEYDSDVTSTVTLDGNDTFGLGVVEKQSNRTTCMEPAGVGMDCTSTWSWRLVKM